MTGSRPDRYIHGLIDAFLAMAAESFDSETDVDRRRDAALNLVRHSTLIAAHLCGKEMLAVAYGNRPDDGDRAASLRALAERLALSQNLFWGMDEPSDPGSIAAAIDEIEAIANGDAPRLFSKTQAKKGQKRSSYRLALCELRALEWLTYFDSTPKIDKETKTDLRNQVPAAFGIEAGALAKWPARLRKRLGESIFEDALKFARGSAAAGWNLRSGKLSNSEALLADGQEYRSELRSAANFGKD